VNIALLRRLREADGAFIASANLGAGGHEQLAELEAFGFRFERHPYLGVAYRGPAHRLCPDQIEWALEPRRVGRRIAVWDRVRSTNDLAGRAAASRTNDGLVVLAEEQTAGRGRRGRTWSAPARSSVLMSALLFPPEPVAGPEWLTALGAVATAVTVEEWTSRPARIKWPNDVRVDGRKIAGILVERGQGSVIGIGLNVNLAEGDFPEDIRALCTSIAILTGDQADRSEVARTLIRHLDEFYCLGLAEGPESLGSRWRARFEAMGRTVLVQTPSLAISGRLVDADLLRDLTIAPDEGPALTIPLRDVLSLSCDLDASGSI
jgi:BirA family biotin operon repressor/biotin-[acetyl-CoA-carboxylase] ligase